MIRVLVVDDHPAVRAGLVSVLRAEPGFVPVAAVESPDAALTEAERQPVDVALIDYGLGSENGLLLARALGAAPEPVRAVIYSAFAGQRLAVSARLAGAGALLDKGQPVEAIFAALREVAAGDGRLPEMGPEAIDAAASHLDPEQLPLFGMTIAGESPEAAASVLGQTSEDVERELAELIERISPLVDDEDRLPRP